MSSKYSQEPGVAVVIPHFDRLSDTAECCRALEAQTLAPAAVFVVDNDSQTHTAAELTALCPHARVLRLETNRGFAGAVNEGIRAAMAMGNVSYVWVLNNDTVCPPDTLAKLMDAADADPHIGLVGCPLLEGTDISRRRQVPAGKTLKGPCAIPVHAKADHAPDYLSGTSILIRRRLLEDIGLFDEGFFFFFEDADFSRRALEKGWQLAVANNASITHKGSSTIGSMALLQAHAYRAGHVRYLRKYSHHPKASALPPFLFRLAADAIRLQMDAVRGNRRGWQEGWQTPLA